MMPGQRPGRGVEEVKFENWGSDSYSPGFFKKCIDSCKFSTFWYSFSMLYLFIVMLKSMS